MAQMNYRSMSFHAEGGVPDERLVRRGAELGFNDIQFRTEGRTVPEMEKLRDTADRQGIFQLADELDMTVSAWVHEIEDYDDSWGPIALDNDRLWDALEERYEYILNDLMPELDKIGLTIVETYCWITEPPLLEKLVQTVNEVCREAEVELILRSFIWHPQELDNVREALSDLPEDISVMNKAVPNDWQFRSSYHPLIGAVGDRTEYIEQDIANEYARRDFTAGCMTDILAEQFEFWDENNVDGFTVRVARYVDDTESSGQKGVSRPYIAGEYMNSDIFGHPNEVNLWALGYLVQGKSVDEAWRDFANHYFGDEAAETMIEALKPTGEVLNEGLCVDALHFGRTNWNGNRITDRGGTPAHRSMVNRYIGTIRARRQTEEEAIYNLFSNPFAQRSAKWRFDESYVPTYHRIRKGHPAIIERKQRAYDDALRVINRSLSLIDSVEDALPENAHEYFRFKVAENKYHLKAMCEAQLAWLKASNRLYYAESDGVYNDAGTIERPTASDVKDHLAALEELIDVSDAEKTIEWAGKSHTLKQGAYLDVVRYIHEFRQHWRLEDEDFKMYSEAFRSP